MLIYSYSKLLLEIHKISSCYCYQFSSIMAKKKKRHKKSCDEWDKLLVLLWKRQQASGPMNTKSLPLSPIFLPSGTTTQNFSHPLAPLSIISGLLRNSSRRNPVVTKFYSSSIFLPKYPSPVILVNRAKHHRRKVCFLISLEPGGLSFL